MHSARVLADSLSPAGVRLTTLEITFPRIVLAEFNTHRVFSRNSASSRAIPIEKMLKLVLEQPYVPSEWGKNQKGMQADEELSASEAEKAIEIWLSARDAAVERVKALLEVGVHKQLTNRLLEPFMWHTVIVTGTEWANYFHLRCHKDAHPDIRKVSEAMVEAFETSTPKNLGYKDWHLPLIYPEDYDDAILRNPQNPLLVQAELCKISVGRCARVSYLTHDGQRDHSKDIELFDRLLVGGHMSPFEHVATPLPTLDLGALDDEDGFNKRTGGFSATQPEKAFVGNFRGWVQYRKTIPHEEDLLGSRETV